MKDKNYTLDEMRREHVDSIEFGFRVYEFIRGMPYQDLLKLQIAISANPESFDPNFERMVYDMQKLRLTLGR